MAMMTAEEALKNAQGLTFEKVWASIQALEQNLDRKLQEYIESSKENERKVAAAHAETEKEMAKLDKQLGELTNRFGELDAGFYVIVQSGDTMKISIPEGFQPKDFKGTSKNRLFLEVPL